MSGTSTHTRIIQLVTEAQFTKLLIHYTTRQSIIGKISETFDDEYLSQFVLQLNLLNNATYSGSTHHKLYQNSKTQLN